MISIHKPFNPKFTILDVIKEQNRTLELLVSYESQYRGGGLSVEEIRNRILSITDFIKET